MKLPKLVLNISIGTIKMSQLLIMTFYSMIMKVADLRAETFYDSTTKINMSMPSSKYFGTKILGEQVLNRIRDP